MYYELRPLSAFRKQPELYLLQVFLTYEAVLTATYL